MVCEITTHKRDRYLRHTIVLANEIGVRHHHVFIFSQSKELADALIASRLDSSDEIRDAGIIFQGRYISRHHTDGVVLYVVTIDRQSTTSYPYDCGIGDR